MIKEAVSAPRRRQHHAGEDHERRDRAGPAGGDPHRRAGAVPAAGDYSPEEEAIYPVAQAFLELLCEKPTGI